MNFDWHNPYPSVRTPVFARNLVATSQPLAAQAGLRMLHSGGNAVDAAVAAAAVLTLTEPCSNGLGADNFAIVWDPSARRCWDSIPAVPRPQRGRSITSAENTATISSTTGRSAAGTR
jgi:gamma-glutamyltranspeptidase